MGYYYVILLILISSTVFYAVRRRNRVLYFSEFRTRNSFDDNVAFFYENQLMISAPRITNGKLKTPRTIVGNVSLFNEGTDSSIGFCDDSSLSFATDAKCANGKITCNEVYCDTLRLKPRNETMGKFLTVERKIGSVDLGSGIGYVLTAGANGASYSPYTGNVKARRAENDFVKFNRVMGEITRLGLRSSNAIIDRTLGFDKTGNCIDFRSTLNLRNLLPPKTANDQFLRHNNGTLTWTSLEKFENRGRSLMMLNKPIDIDDFPRPKRLDKNGSWNDFIRYADNKGNNYYLATIDTSEKYLKESVSVNFDGATGQVFTLTEEGNLEFKHLPRYRKVYSDQLAFATLFKDGVTPLSIGTGSSKFALVSDGSFLNKLELNYEESIFADIDSKTNDRNQLVLWNGEKLSTDSNKLFAPSSNLFVDKLTGEKDVSLYCLKSQELIRFDLDTPIDNNTHYLTYDGSLKWSSVCSSVATKFTVDKRKKLNFITGGSFKNPLLLNKSGIYIKNADVTNMLITTELKFESFAHLFDKLSPEINISAKTNGLLIYDYGLKILTFNDNLQLCASIGGELKFVPVSNNLDADYVLGIRANNFYKDDTLSPLMNLPNPDSSSTKMACLTYLDTLSNRVQYYPDLEFPNPNHDSFLINTTKLTWITMKRVFYNDVLNQFENVINLINHPATLEEEEMLFTRNGKLVWLPFGNRTFKPVATVEMATWMSLSETLDIFHQTMYCNSNHIIWIQIKITVLSLRNKTVSYLRITVKANNSVKNHFIAVHHVRLSHIRHFYFNDINPGKNDITVTLFNEDIKYVKFENPECFIFRFS